MMATPFVLSSALRATNAKPRASLADELESIRGKHGIPALSLLSILDGKITEHEAVGLRRADSTAEVTKKDRFHIGSCTKSMTATLAAMLVEDKKLSWNTTVAEALPRLDIHPGFKEVTIDQLLRHMGGLPTNAPAAAWGRAWKRVGTPAAQRAEFVAALLASPPAHAPGDRYVYSNQGYAVAGHMLEIVAGRPWEEVIHERLFSPLGMSSAGFGVPDRLGQGVEPWGHARKDGRWVPIQQDNPPAIAPAGTVHCSLGDLAAYARMHLDRGKTQSLLSAQSFQHLHTPAPRQEYAGGWLSLDRPWAGGRALHHAGSNTYWYVVMWLAPNRNFAALAAANAGDAARACDEAAALAIQRVLR